MKIFLAGRVAAESDGVVIGERQLQGRQGRLLFAYLVAAQGRPVPRDELADVLWEGTPPATWDKALGVLASKLRGVARCERRHVDRRVRLLPARASRRHMGRHCRGRRRGERSRSGARGGRRRRSKAGGGTCRVVDATAGPAGRRRNLGRGEAARARRCSRASVGRVGRRLPPFGRPGRVCALGRAGGRGRAVSRKRLPAV